MTNTGINSSKNDIKAKKVSKKKQSCSELLNENKKDVNTNDNYEIFNSDISIISSSTSKNNTNTTKERIKSIVNKLESIYKEGRTFDVKIRNKDTGFDIIHKFIKLSKIDNRLFIIRVFYGGQEIEETHCVYYHQIKNGDTLQILTTERGETPDTYSKVYSKKNERRVNVMEKIKKIANGEEVEDDVSAGYQESVVTTGQDKEKEGERIGPAKIKKKKKGKKKKKNKEEIKSKISELNPEEKNQGNEIREGKKENEDKDNFNLDVDEIEIFDENETHNNENSERNILRNKNNNKEIQEKNENKKQSELSDLEISERKVEEKDQKDEQKL